MHRLFRIASQVPRLTGRLVWHGLPRRTLIFGPLSLGDDLLCTTVLHEARRRGRPFAMCTARPELFERNPDPSAVLPIDDYYMRLLKAAGCSVVSPYYASADPLNLERDLFQPGHVLAEMCRLSGLHGQITLRPYVYLSPNELVQSRIATRILAVHSTAAAAAVPFATKEWGPAKFADVVTALAGDFTTVQLGSISDPPLPVARDLRGRTSLREAAAILANATLLLGLEGFLAHLARAVDCPAVVILGGRTQPSTVGYSANINLYSSVPCAPCGLRNDCPHHLVCQQQITVEAVIAAVRELSSRPRDRNLPVDTVEVP